VSEPTRSSPPGRDPARNPQVGRRPPQPLVPIVSGVMWIVVGIVVLVRFTAGWRYVVGIVAIGIGLLFLRGGAAALARQAERRSSRRR